MEQRQLKEKPRNFVQELIAATPRSKPNTPAALRTKPSLSYSLTLVPAAGEGSGKRGTAVFRLYTWRYSGTHNDTVFEDFDASWAQRSYMPCAYATIMEVRTRTCTDGPGLVLGQHCLFSHMLPGGSCHVVSKHVHGVILYVHIL